MRRPALSLGVASVLLFSGVPGLAAQNRSCDLLDSRQVNSVTQAGGRVSHVSHPRFVCTDGTRIEADSSITFEASSFTQLFGNVLFRDGPQELRAERAQYYSQAVRLQAQDSVSLTDLNDGSTIKGENLVMLQAGDERAEDDMTMRGGRPHARFFTRAVPPSDTLVVATRPEDASRADSLATELPQPMEAPPDNVDVEATGAGDVPVPPPDESPGADPPRPPDPPTPFDVDADLIRLVGDRVFQARGRVEIRQEALRAYGDSMEYRKDIGSLTLFEGARVLSPDEEGPDTLDVRGDTITMTLPNNRLDEVVARGHAQLVNESVDMKGPVLRIFFMQDEVDRIVSVMGPVPTAGSVPPLPSQRDSAAAASVDPFARPRATAEDFLLTGDSIEVKTPGGALERVFAAGRAHGISSARDSINAHDAPEFVRNDWIEGRTITATFAEHEGDSTDTGPDAADPGEGRYRLDMLVASGGARSFYRSASDSTAAGGGATPLEFNYVLGDEIRLFMGDGEVDRMEVDNATGAYFQPVRRAAAPVSDSLPSPASDTTAAPPAPGNP